MSKGQMIFTVLVLALSVWITRFLPFLIFKEKTKIPSLVEYLGKVLPAAMMGLLVIYCMKDVSFSDPARLIATLLAVVATALLHWFKRNMILSIAAGTVLYMILIRVLPSLF